MPHDSSTEPDTRRLLTDGSTSRERPAPPTPARPAEPGGPAGPDGGVQDGAAPVLPESAAPATTRESSTPERAVPVTTPETAAPPAPDPDDVSPGSTPPADVGQTEGPEATVVIPTVDDRPAPVGPTPSSPAADPEPAVDTSPAPARPDSAPAGAGPAPDAGDTVQFPRDDLPVSRARASAEDAPSGGTAPIDWPPASPTAVLGAPVGATSAGTAAGAAEVGAPSAGTAAGAAPVGPPPGGGRDDGAGNATAPAGGRPGEDRAWWRRRAVLAPAAAVLALGAAYGLDLAVAGDDVPRGTVVAGVEVGGLSPAAAADRLSTELAPRLAADHVLVADDVESVLHPPAAGIALDVPATVDAVDGQPLNPWTRLVSMFSDQERDPVLTEDETALAAQLEQLAAQVDRAPVDATVAIEGTTARVVEPVEGRTLDRAGAAEAITAALAQGGDPATPIQLPVETTAVRVGTEEAQRVLEETVTPALSAPVTVVGASGSDAVVVPVSAIAASLAFTPQDDGTLEAAVDPEALQAEVGEEFAVFGSPAQDARFEVSGGSISVVPSVDGEGIDPAVLAGQLLPVLREEGPRQVTATLGPVPASFTTAQAEALGITEEVSSFTTNFTNPASGTNIRVVAGEVDGALVLPGETFSLNTHTGPRGTAQGYVPAGVISNGEFSTAVGGGISQFATTMFNAVFFAGLEDVFHKPHSYYISRYPAGREATVYEGAIDLQWRNDTETGIYVQTEWVPGAITVRLWGTKYYEIESVSSNRYSVTQPVVQEKVDDGACTPQPGQPGFSITVTRVFNELGSGAEVRREDFQTRYAAEPVVRCVPPPETAPEAPAGAPVPPAPPGPGG